MSRSLWCWIALPAVLIPSVASAENWFVGSWRNVRCAFWHNVDWPEQYLDHDRSAARAPFSAMVANGWRSQNTISNYHFNETTGELNDTGRLKVKSILTQTPPEWRALFVLRADTPALTAARVKAVQDQALALLQGDPMPPLMITTIEPQGMSGAIVNGINTRYNENAVAPILPPAQRSTEN